MCAPAMVAPLGDENVEVSAWVYMEICQGVR